MLMGYSLILAFVQDFFASGVMAEPSSAVVAATTTALSSARNAALRLPSLSIYSLAALEEACVFVRDMCLQALLGPATSNLNGVVPPGHRFTLPELLLRALVRLTPPPSYRKTPATQIRPSSDSMRPAHSRRA